MAIHPTAIVDFQTRIADSAEIGPYCVIGPQVEIGARTRLMAHVYLEGVTTIGEDNIFFPYSSIGVAPQDLKYKGELSETRIGSRNKIREFVTIQRGTEGGGRKSSRRGVIRKEPRSDAFPASCAAVELLNTCAPRRAGVARRRRSVLRAPWHWGGRRRRWSVAPG